MVIKEILKMPFSDWVIIKTGFSFMYTKTDFLRNLSKNFLMLDSKIFVNYNVMKLLRHYVWRWDSVKKKYVEKCEPNYVNFVLAKFPQTSQSSEYYMEKKIEKMVEENTIDLLNPIYNSRNFSELYVNSKNKYFKTTMEVIQRFIVNKKIQDMVLVSIVGTYWDEKPIEIIVAYSSSYENVFKCKVLPYRESKLHKGFLFPKLVFNFFKRVLKSHRHNKVSNLLFLTRPDFPCINLIKPILKDSAYFYLGNHINNDSNRTFALKLMNKDLVKFIMKIKKKIFTLSELQKHIETEFMTSNKKKGIVNRIIQNYNLNKKLIE